MARQKASKAIDTDESVAPGISDSGIEDMIDMSGPIGETIALIDSRREHDRPAKPTAWSKNQDTILLSLFFLKQQWTTIATATSHSEEQCSGRIARLLGEATLRRVDPESDYAIIVVKIGPEAR